MAGIPAAPPAPDLTAIQARIDALAQRPREQVRDFIDSRRFPWPTNSSAVLSAVAREVARIEAEAAQEADAYGDEQPPAEPPPRRSAPYEPPVGSPFD